MKELRFCRALSAGPVRAVGLSGGRQSGSWPRSSSSDLSFNLHYRRGLILLSKPLSGVRSNIWVSPQYGKIGLATQSSLSMPDAAGEDAGDVLAIHRRESRREAIFQTGQSEVISHEEVASEHGDNSFHVE